MKSIHATVLYTGSGVEKDVFLSFDGERIDDVGPREKGEVVGRFDVVTPAFLDAHSHIGMARAGEPSDEDEANEHLEPIMAHADALDSVQMDDLSFKESVEMGVLYSCVVPGSGNIIGGKSALVKNYGRTTSDAFMGRSGIKAAFGYNPRSTTSWKGSRPNTRMGAAALLRARLHEVREKVRKKKKLPEEKAEELSFTYEEELLRKLLTGEEHLRVHVHKADDISVLLRIVDEFSLKVVVDHTCDIHEAESYQELKKRGVPVVFGPCDAFAYKTELKHESWRNIRYLIDSGVQYGLMTDHPVTLQKMLLLQLRWFLRLGLTKEQAIGVITHQNAKILGLWQQLGTLERGKWASFIGWNGDPFDLTKYPVAVYGEGKQVYGE
jgi:imidazolonepropionase-like amidohydrolase